MYHMFNFQITKKKPKNTNENYHFYHAQIVIDNISKMIFGTNSRHIVIKMVKYDSNYPHFLLDTNHFLILQLLYNSCLKAR